MPDPIDQNNPPVTPPAPLPDPQAMVDAALSPPAPIMAAVPPMPEPVVVPVTPLPTPEPMPTPDPATVAMRDDTPLAFVTPPPSSTTTTTTTTTQPVDGAAPLPPVPPAPSVVDQPKKKKSILSMMLIGLLTLMGLAGGIGYYVYLTYGTANIATIASIEEMDKDSCGGCSGPNGGWLVWRNGRCRVSGSCESTNEDKNSENPNIVNANTDVQCTNAGGRMCTGTDTRGEQYNICVPQNETKACYQVAIDAGYTMQIGVLKCVNSGGGWVLDTAYYDSNTAPGSQTAEEVRASYNAINGTSDVDPCSKTYTPAADTEKYICKIGVVGQGTDSQPGVPYSGGACTAINGKVFTGNQNGCYCGTVQVDTPNGHTSYSSTCGCDKTTTASEPPTITTTPTLVCTGLTQTPAAPVIGTAMTFSCEAAATPAGSVKFSYEYRYSINNGAWKTMATDRTLKPKGSLTIAACGTYTVECRACGPINGVSVCDPIWVGATQ